MKNIFLAIICLLALCSQSCKSGKVDDTAVLVLKGATVFDGNGNTITSSLIVIRDGRIVSVGQDESVIPANAEIVDVAGKYITPGLVDAHVHFFQTGFFDARPDALNLKDSLPYEEVYDYQKANPQRYYEAYLRSGITAVYDVGDFTWTFDLPRAGELAPHIATAGPLLTPAPKDRVAGFNTRGDTVMVHLDDPEVGVRNALDYLRRGATGIKIWGLSTQDSVFMNSLQATAEAVEKAGGKIIAHATSLEQAKATLRLPAIHLLVHSVQDREVDQEFLELAKSKQIFYNPTLVVSRGYYNTYRAIMDGDWTMSDPHNVVDQKTRELLEGATAFRKFITDTAAMRQRLQFMPRGLAYGDSIMALNLRKVHEAGIDIVVGTDAGNPGTLHGISIYDEMEAMQAAGLPAQDIIVMATRNGAAAMQRQEDFGTLEAGKIADLIILDRDPSMDIRNMRSIKQVMREGKLLSVAQRLKD